jgi:hypothetical protein
VRNWLLVGLGIVAVSCTSKVIQPVGPVGAPAAVAAKFMQAIADSNIAQLGELWGTSAGPAATVGKPSNWGQRVTVIHAYLKGGTHRILGEDSGVARTDRRTIMVELSREGCVKTVPFTMVFTKQGSWLVNAIDLNAAGVPGRPCAPNNQAAAPPRGGGSIR